MSPLRIHAGPWLTGAHCLKGSIVGPWLKGVEGPWVKEVHCSLGSKGNDFGPGTNGPGPKALGPVDQGPGTSIGQGPGPSSLPWAGGAGRVGGAGWAGGRARQLQPPSQDCYPAAKIAIRSMSLPGQDCYPARRVGQARDRPKGPVGPRAQVATQWERGLTSTLDLASHLELGPSESPGPWKGPARAQGPGRPKKLEKLDTTKKTWRMPVRPKTQKTQKPGMPAGASNRAWGPHMTPYEGPWGPYGTHGGSLGLFSTLQNMIFELQIRSGWREKRQRNGHAALRPCSPAAPRGPAALTALSPLAINAAQTKRNETKHTAPQRNEPKRTAVMQLNVVS